MSQRARFVPREELARLLEERRRAGSLGRVVLATGCFEVLHAGHVGYLEDARSRGDCLIVALNGDGSVRELKGEGRPIAPLEDRAAVLCALAAVDYVTAFHEPTLEDTLRILRPDVHAKGTDYTPDEVPEHGVDAELGIEIAICGEPKTHSSTDLIARVRGPIEATVLDTPHTE
ncbi:MAG: adenylyltransferase/cytidyltransferase family protein [Planctomycetota bacterium]|nr:adenylyltransferase/cytidyltransferase family protein [Planctomycetota bacterium]